MMTEEMTTEEERERFELSFSRLKEITEEEGTLPEKWLSWFKKQAELLLFCEEIIATRQQVSDAVLKERNRRLYEDILPENYAESYCNPAKSVRVFGQSTGRLVSAVAAEMRSAIPGAFEGEREELLIRAEFLLELYGIVMDAAADKTEPEYSYLRDALYFFISDYADRKSERRVEEMVVPDLGIAVGILEDADLSTTDYLYRYGEYITENELRFAAYINALPQEKIDRIADTYTEGYRLGFIRTGKDLSVKKTVNIRYPIGAERIIRKAVATFRGMGLSPVIYRAKDSLFTGRGVRKMGYYGANPNRQYDYDHKEDIGLILDGQFVTRKLECLEAGFAAYRQQAKDHAGPAVMETFGEDPFTPANCEEAVRLTKDQQTLDVRYRTESTRITTTYIPGKERSFTIISLPVPEIADTEERFGEIFDAVLRINTLDYQTYEGIQSTMIEAMNEASFVHIKGMGENRTDLKVALYPLTDPEKQAIYENCVADVNIPVGEIFTTPVLKGTNGTLHVSRVYLNGLEFRDLTVTFTDGMVTDYDCGNFADPAENRRYFEDNVLFHHKTLPMGEAAIGTNTLAYVLARRYGIEERLPILIAEKTGPHFALGDTCYSHAEGNHKENPDGREIVAKDNEISLLRDTEPDKAYFGCHTDITLPYDELGLLEGIRSDGSTIPIIDNGRFVLPGTEKLNEAFDEKE